MSKIASRTPSELARMREAGRVVAEALELVRAKAEPCVATEDLDRMVEDLIIRRKCKPAFKGYRGYPATICTSINEQVVHGIPGKRKLKEGDLLSVDVGAFYEGYAADAAITILIGQCSAEAVNLTMVTRQALEAAIEVVRAGVRVSEISRAIQRTAENAGYHVVRQYSGHGIGCALHEEPQIPNAVSVGFLETSPILPRGAVIAIEPMVNVGTDNVEVLSDGWTVVTKDRSLSAHFEHTVVVEENGPAIITVL
jgi:methionyl aminopeptidase